MEAIRSIVRLVPGPVDARQPDHQVVTEPPDRIVGAPGSTMVSSRTQTGHLSRKQASSQVLVNVDLVLVHAGAHHRESGGGRNAGGAPAARRYPEDKSYLEAVRERVVIFDGATGTNLQLRDLTADDFGGPAARGLQRDPGRHPPRRHRRPAPVVLRGRRRRGRDRHVRRRCRYTLAEYGIADRAHELNVKAAQIAREVADGVRRAGWPAPSARAPSSRPSARSASPSCATPTRSRPAACSRAASTCSSSRRSSTCSRPRPPSSAAGGPWPPPAARCPSRCRSPSSSPAACCPAPRSAPPSPPSTPCGPT